MITFTKEYIAPNGATLNFHKIVKIEATVADNSAVALVASWPSEIQYLANAPHLWITYHAFPFPDVVLTLVTESLLASTDFAGAVEVTDVLLDLDTAKARKLQEISAWRQKANSSTFTFLNKQISVDAVSKDDISGVTQEVALTGNLPEGFPGGWKTVDNSYVPIPDVEAWKDFVRAMVLQGTSNFARSQALRVLVNNATTIEEVAAISWDTPIS